MVDLKTARVGDEIIFANGVTGKITVIYNNGGLYFTRWDEFDDEGKKQPWSGTDKWCCSPGLPRDGKLGYEDHKGDYTPSPSDIVAIIKPPLEDLQDEITRLNQELKGYKDDPR